MAESMESLGLMVMRLEEWTSPCASARLVSSSWWRAALNFASSGDENCLPFIAWLKVFCSSRVFADEEMGCLGFLGASLMGSIYGKSSAPNSQIPCAFSRKPSPMTGLSSLSLDLLIRYIDNVLSAIINQGLGCKIFDSRTELRDLVQPVAADFSKLFDGISEGAKMFSDQKFLKSQLSTDAHSVAVDVLKGLGSTHWVAVGLLAIANVLERFDNISANDRECIDLLKAMLKLGKYLKQVKDIYADLHKEILEDMSEAAKLIVSGAILCCSFITSNKLSKFLLTKKIREELFYVPGKVDFMKADLMLQMQVLTVTTLTFYHRQNNVSGGNEENNCPKVTEQDTSEQSKDNESVTEGRCETELEASGSDTIHIRFKRDELERATKGFTTEIGRGGFGCVYKGILSDGKRVAIKILGKESRQGEREWMNELRTLTKLRHRNITELVGYCFEDGMMLVFHYIPRNLSDVIFEEIEMIIDWPTRLKIILDIDATESDITTYRTVAGTPGYLDPEYFATGRPSVESDIYSFGVTVKYRVEVM
ncbi:hypothetical protein SUGI_0702800 [Cryptomeria japonica]|nr:hypothetical protein SUGI_0702800 [Cryptomeria japonica]